MECEFSGRVFEWRGPAPYVYVAMPEEDADDLKEAARGQEYWGQVAVTATIGDTTFETAVFPKNGTYLLPLKLAVQKAEQIELDDEVEVTLRLGTRARPDHH